MLESYYIWCGNTYGQTMEAENRTVQLLYLFF